jgi:hypothetical protein
MKSDLKAKWIAALRSGDYKQVRHFLHARGGYCCLGVLCEAAGLKSESVEPGVDYYGYFDAGSTNRYTSTPPPSIYEQLPEKFASKLVKMNDSEHKSFAEIADWIEANIPDDDNR